MTEIANKKKVTIINSIAGTGDFQRAIQMASTLYKYDVTVLAWNRTSETLKSGKFNNYNISLFNFRPFGKNMLAMFFSYIIWWSYVVFFSLKNRTDIYHVQGIFAYIPIIPVKIFHYKTVKVVYDLIDLLADSFDWPNFIRTFLASLENFFIKYSDALIVVDIRKQEIKMHNVKKLAVVTNCPPDLLSEFKKDLNENNNEFIVYYGGAILKTRGISHVCEALKTLNGFKFIIAGDGKDKSELELKYRKFSNIEFIGHISSIDSLRWTYKADAIPIFYDPKIRINRKASPAKLYDAMMCKTAVIVNSEAVPVAQTVNEEKCGLIVDYGDVDSIRNSILQLKNNPEIELEMGKNCRNAFEREYNWNVMGKRLINLYNEV